LLERPFIRDAAVEKEHQLLDGGAAAYNAKDVLVKAAADARYQRSSTLHRGN
jgi:hypothetical protein